MSNIYQRLSDILSSGHSAFIQTIYTGTQGKTKTLQRSLDTIPANTENQLQLLTPVLTEQSDSFQFVESFIPKERLFIFGSGHVGYALYLFAIHLGFDVVIIDERPEFCNAERFPLASRICCCNFVDAAAHLDIRSYDYAVIVSHGHRSDYACLKQLLDGEKPTYLGMIGSRKKVKGVMDLLRNEGYDSEILDRVCSPIGLPIGASTPEEIAISILSEMICYKRQPEKYSFAPNRTVNKSDVSYQTIEYLSKQTFPTPQAIVTIQRNLGSSPRHTGAKMVVDREGNILSGTIGGGRGEYLAAEAAKSIIGTGQYQVLQLDLNGTADSGSKPCCGGIIEIFIEDLSQ